mmetsp:Transcript_26178/g.73225  ORF Transcript_26178/g.73225 Transcript_26178/m.73225 type:complete len:204 (-) Transcript_26178:2069-2680(-)
MASLRPAVCHKGVDPRYRLDVPRHAAHGHEQRRSVVRDPWRHLRNRAGRGGVFWRPQVRRQPIQEYLKAIQEPLVQTEIGLSSRRFTGRSRTSFSAHRWKSWRSAADLLGDLHPSREHGFERYGGAPGVDCFFDDSKPPRLQNGVFGEDVLQLSLDVSEVVPNRGDMGLVPRILKPVDCKGASGCEAMVALSHPVQPLKHLAG